MTDGLPKVFDSVVGIGSQLSFGSGWVAHANGLIVTNHHVVRYLSQVKIRTRSGEEVQGRVVYVDARLDIAFVLPLVPLALPPLARGDSRKVSPGEPVSAIGHPYGLDYSLTRGVISATKREDRGREFLQTDALLNPGNSGGPLLDAQYRVLAVNTRSATLSSIGLDLAIPVHCFEEALNSMAGPAEEVLKREPRYGCGECGAAIRPEETRCKVCGAQIPYLDEPLYPPPTWIQAQNKAHRLLLSLGLQPNTISVGHGIWLLESKTGEFLFSIVGDGDAIETKTQIAMLPARNQEEFQRFALAANDVATGDAKLSLRGETLELSRQESVRHLEPEAATRALKEFGATAAKLKAILRQSFQAREPLPFGLDRVK